MKWLLKFKKVIDTVLEILHLKKRLTREIKDLKGGDK